MIVLVGFMGAGKSTVGQLVADRLELPFVDTDLVIERRHGPIPAIFERCSEAGFREIEAAAINATLAGPDAVVSLGGGAVETSAVRAALKGVRVGWLQIALDEALARLGNDPTRPVLNSPGLAERFARRQELYREVASFCVNTAGISPADVAERVCAA